MTKASALTSLFSAAAKGANTLGSAFDTINDSIGMASNFVSKASQEQLVRYDRESKTFLAHQSELLAVEVSEIQRRGNQYVTENPELEEIYTKTYNEFMQAHSKK